MTARAGFGEWEKKQMPDSNMASAPITAPAMTSYAWYAIVLLFLANTLSYIDRMVLAVLVESIRVDIPMSDTQIGLLTGLAFALFYAVAGLAIGRLADIVSRKRLLVVSIAAWSMATAVSGAATSFAHMLLARLAVGTGEAGTIPSVHSLIADYCPFRARPIGYAIVGAGGPVGLAIGLAGGGYIADQYDWRMAFVVAGLLGIPVAILVAATLREPQRGAQESGSDAMVGSGYGETLRLLMARRSFPMLVMATATIAFVLYGVAQWVPAYLIRAYGLSTAEVGLYFGIAMGLGSAIGSLAGGILCSWLLKRDRSWLLRLPMLVALMLPPIYLAAFHVASLELALFLILLVNIIGALQFGAMPAAIHSVVPAGMRGTATSLFGLVSALLGIGLAPFAIGVMSDWLGGGDQSAASLRIALSIAVFMSLGTAAFLALARRTLEDDQRANGVAFG